VDLASNSGAGSLMRGMLFVVSDAVAAVLMFCSLLCAVCDVDRIDNAASRDGGASLPARAPADRNIP
ncbi:MAG TPA: hypothetical protein VE360_18945, partial [Pyrinomonadaceae bacterium]|nr:hypothetical protein [Pyrinomonadaceae bacterium]